MADTVIFAEQKLTGFTDGGLPMSPAPFVPVEGEIYRISWDGAEHICACAVNANLWGVPAISDVVVDAEGNPVSGSFAIIYYTAEELEAEADTLVFFSIETTATEHTVSVSQIATTVIVESATFTSALDAEFGYFFPIAEDVELFEIGKQCAIVWNGKVYLCTAQDASTVMEGTHCLMGNGTDLGLDGNGEPFIIGLTTEGFMLCLCLTDTAETEHTVSLYHVNELSGEDTGGSDTGDGEIGGTEEETQEGIILKDRNGNDVAYYGIETVTFDTTTEGKQQTYTKGVAVEDMEIVPDFSIGDMPVTADDGILVKSATIIKPTDLVPEHIKKGKKIAGVVGNFAGDIVNKTATLDFRDYSNAIYSEEVMDAILADRNNLGKQYIYLGASGKYVSGQCYAVIDEYEAFDPSACSSATVEVASGTELSASIECNVGDLIIAGIAIRSELTSLAEGWTLISTSQSVNEINTDAAASSYFQTLSFAYKYASSTTESIVVTQETAGRIYINLVSFAGASGFTNNAYQYKSCSSGDTTTSATFNRPSSKIVLWGVTRYIWTIANPPVWGVSNEALTIQLGSTTQSRLLLAIDVSNDETVTFMSGTASTTDAYLCGALSIELAPACSFKTIDEVPFDILDSITVEADEDTVMSKVIIPKPETLVPENVAYGKEIGGVKGTNGGPIIAEPDWIDDTCFWDYDGTLAAKMSVVQATSLAELPTPPRHDGLTFVGWNYTLEQIKAYDYPIDVGAMYVPTDGKTHLTLNVTYSGYLAVPLNFQQTVANGVSIDWGDGTSVTTVAGTGVVKATHTYATVGIYKVTLTVASGCTMTLGGGTAATTFVGGGTSQYREYLTEIYVGPNVELSEYAIYSPSCAAITLPNTLQIIPKAGIQYIYDTPVLTVPDSVIELKQYALNSTLGSYSRANRLHIISVPESISTINNYSISSQQCTRLSIPKVFTELPEGFCSGMRTALRFFMSNNVTSIGNRALSDWCKLQKIRIPSELVTIGDYNFYNCYSLNSIELPSKLTSIGSGFLSSNRGIRSLRIPRSVATISGNYFAQSSSIAQLIVEGPTDITFGSSAMDWLNEIIFLSETPPTKFNVPSYYCDVYVPDLLYDDFKAFSTVYSDYKNRIRKHSEYPGVLPT